MLRIAIDGPGGAGKSSVAKAVAKELGIIYVDTGALYRTIGVYMLRHNTDPSDEAAVTSLLPNISLELKFKDGAQLIILDGQTVGDEIRTPEASMAASAVSALGPVREFLLQTQKSIAEENDVIMDGRDIGTVILPYAEVKIFLTASPEARAKRRYNELIAKGIDTTYEKVYSEMVQRDENDSTRALAPCVPAKDATVLDNSELDFDGTVKAVLDIINKVKKERAKKGHPFYMTMRFIIAPIYKFFARVRVTGLENIPAEGGAVICCNHIGVNDIFLLGTVFPRQIRFLAKKEWFSVPVLSSLMRALGAVQLDRGGRDVGALRSAVNLVKEGKQIAIFPQGHRYPGVNPAETPIKNGAALITYHAHADVIPVCIKTKGEKYKFLQPIEVIIGKPIKYSEFNFEKGGSEEYRVATAKMFSTLCALGGYNALPAPGDTEEKN